MIEVHNDNFSIKDNYNIKDNTIMDNETNTIKTEQLGFDSGTKANTNNVDTEQGTPLFAAIMKADPTLASDAKKKMDAENEKRVTTLRENGALGGRPRIVRKDLAKQYFDAKCVVDGHCILYHYRGEWYLYKHGCYARTSEEDIEKKVTGWLIRSEAADVTKTIVKDVLMNLKSDEFCGFTSDHAMPCFISTGESAKGFVSMKNGFINVNEVVAAMKNGLPLPPPLPHTPDLFTTFRLPYDYDPNATCPRFEHFLDGVQPNPENRERVLMLAGLLLTPDTSYNTAFFLFGPAGTGKSVLLNVLTGLVGIENVCSVPLGDFSSRFSKWPLTEKLANIVSDMPAMPESGRCADVEGVFKRVTEGGEIQIEHKGVDVCVAKVTARCVFATNTMPYFADRSGAVRDRLSIIPFTQVFRNTAQQNPHLTEELLEELPGILLKALQGLVKLRELTASTEVKTFPQCEEGRLILDEHMADCDHEVAFLREETEAASPNEYLVALSLYKDYSDWAKDRGYYPVGYDKFREAVLRVYPNAVFDRKRIGVRRPTVVYGIDWFSDTPESATEAIPIIPPVQSEQGCASNEGDCQPDLGF